MGANSRILTPSRKWAQRIRSISATWVMSLLRRVVGDIDPVEGIWINDVGRADRRRAFAYGGLLRCRLYHLPTSWQTVPDLAVWNAFKISPRVRPAKILVGPAYPSRSRSLFGATRKPRQVPPP